MVRVGELNRLVPADDLLGFHDSETVVGEDVARHRLDLDGAAQAGADLLRRYVNGVGELRNETVVDGLCGHDTASVGLR